MFKMIALVGAIAGGATYGLYAHTGVFSKCSEGGCPLAAMKSCCEESKPCCEKSEPCCDAEKGSTAPVSVASASCCSIKASAPKPTCCATPCPACAAGCDGCPICAVDCSDCCGASAKTAVAGVAGVFVSAPRK